MGEEGECCFGGRNGLENLVLALGAPLELAAQRWDFPPFLLAG